MLLLSVDGFSLLLLLLYDYRNSFKCVGYFLLDLVMSLVAGVYRFYHVFTSILAAQLVFPFFWMFLSEYRTEVKFILPFRGA